MSKTNRLGDIPLDKLAQRKMDRLNRRIAKFERYIAKVKEFIKEDKAQKRKIKWEYIKHFK